MERDRAVRGGILINKEAIKAMNVQHKNKQFRSWWSNNRYKINRVIFSPIWLGILLKDYIQKKLNARIEWSDEKTQEILDYYVPRYAEWDNDTKNFYFFDNGYGWSMVFAKNYLKRKDRRYWKKYAGFFGGDIRNYLLNQFELDGFIKEICNRYDDWTEIIFKLNEEIEEFEESYHE